MSPHSVFPGVCDLVSVIWCPHVVCHWWSVSTYVACFHWCMFPRIFDAASPSSSLPLDVIIGACAGGAGIAVLFLLIIIVCLCICRLRVNRRGFYHTYEDKTSEPPTMLRYSASLRSISSQTVIPVTEGRSVQKENEFYV